MAEVLPPLIASAVNTAQDLSVRAHISGEMEKGDTYGNTLKVKVFEILEEKLAAVPGISFKKPARGRFALPIVEETSVALLPIRFSSDPKIDRLNAKITMSELRKSLLNLATPNALDRRQATVEEFLDDDFNADTYDASRLDEDAELDQLDEQLARFGRVVTVGFGSNQDRIWELGWGDLREVSGEPFWGYWELLPVAATVSHELPNIKILDSEASNDEVVLFDELEDSDELSLSLREETRLSTDGESK
ncbi:MAG: hypothetical protein ACRDT3_05535 [Glutamicibacter sp.]